MRKFIGRAAVLCAGLALFIGCSHSGTVKLTDGSSSPAAFDSVAVKKVIDSVNQSFAQYLAKGDSVALANCYSTDAKFMGANMPAVVGRKNIQTLFSGFIKGGVTKIAITSTGVWGSENGAAEEGTYTLATKDGHQVDKGKYIVLWKKEDGQWKLFRDCGNSDLPLPAAK